MILELLQLSPLKDQLTAWRGFARAGVTAFEEQNEMSMALLEGKGWTGADFEALLAFIDRADLEYVTLAAEMPVKPPGSEDSVGAAIGSAPALSVLQTLINDANLQAGFVAERLGHGLKSEENGLSDLVLSDEAQVPPGQGLFYSPFDEPGSKYVTEWVKAKVKRMGKEPHPFVRATKRTPLAEVARLVIVGDWGTGVGRALDVRDQMRAALDETPDRERHVVHLGDIYFCGWPDEVKKQFQKCWPVHENEAGIHSWCLNGNHDMYAGGDGYFGMLDKDDRFASQDKSSHFSLGNRHWHILGLDTAYEEWSLSNGQVTWALDERKHADFAGARGILLSHHQPFSAYEGNEPTKSGRLLQESAPLLQNNLTTMWLWGHEHRCVVYEPREFGFAGGAGHLPMGACLGHGGVPAKPTRDQREGVAYVLNESVRRGIENFGMMGFAILDLDGAEASLTCVDELGNRKVVKKFAAA